MNRTQTFEQFLAQQTPHIALSGFLFNLVLTGLLTYWLYRLYVKYGNALSNREIFGRNFVMVGTTTMIIITIVKSSLALSLGLVGALSIVRFRTAIKEPEELAFLFFVIAIGLGFGADQRIITLLGFVAISAIIYLRAQSKKFAEYQNVSLTILSDKSSKFPLEPVIDVLKNSCSKVDLKRLDESHKLTEAIFVLEIQDLSNLMVIKENLKKVDPAISVRFLDTRGF
ncbi:hypothetical protein BVX98_04195 [bacterium F11]|nr:hypothetical protein BVX98_04195 [bacterium F11]